MAGHVLGALAADIDGPPVAQIFKMVHAGKMILAGFERGGASLTAYILST
ncbi:MAG: hypothetical protein ACKVSF_07615 [Alphaproteobacteria bacterium]